MDGKADSGVRMVACDKNSIEQKWEYNEGESQLINKKTRLCIDSLDHQELKQRTCSDIDSQKWRFHMNNS